ncbi:MAG: hypothetical protein V7L27_27395 [Nostoc sp.]|uniref:hypothetical protein n=1 Tax=Nostoc sp. TaxID=1180 RepID=UPI002FF953EA
MQLSLHTAPDVLSLRFCSCVCNRGNSHELLQDSWFLATFGDLGWGKAEGRGQRAEGNTDK